MNEIGVVNSIFDSKALTKAFNDGFTELALILTIPFVFIGLGYLIHKFQEKQNNSKYIKISMLIFITFIFDSILAYEITEKIYNIKKENSFNDLPDYTITMSFQSVNFWLIIFAGFVVYIIWGFVFDFVMESYSKMDKIKVAIQEKEKQIKESEFEYSSIEIEIENMTNNIDENNKKINELNKYIENTIVPKEFEQDIFSFIAGWMAWMKQSGRSHHELEEAHKITDEFIKITILNIENINLN